MADPIDFSRTERIVLLIDLQPLTVLQNPESYIHSVLAASRTILTFSSISSSLVAFKLFFSSLSPIRSSSTVHRLLKKPFSNSLSFDDAITSFDYLRQVLNSLARFSSIDTELATELSRQSHVASSLLQLVHDYAWEKLQTEDLPGTLKNFPNIRQNLVVLFSPAEGCLKCSSEFMNEPTEDSILNESDFLCKKFYDSFSSVKDAFSIRDIHCSWIDVVLDKESNQENLEVGKIESVIKSLGWGFSSTNSIVLGSSLVPFGLVYPAIGSSSNFKGCNALDNVVRSQLALEIADVRGKPLQCNLCDLDLLNVVVPAMEATGSESESLELDKKFPGNFCRKITTLKIKSVFKCGDTASMEGCLSKLVLVRESSRESGSNGKKFSDCSVADRVLEMLSCEMSGFIPVKRAPCWQILLSYLGRGGYMALVSISNENGNTFMGILRPYTVHLALLSITDNMEGKLLESDVPQILKPNVDNDPNEFIDSQSSVVSSTGHKVPLDARKAKKSQKHMYRELKWSSFHEEAYNGSVMELEELYFTKEIKNSKKLMFLKCWIKQTKKSSPCSMTLLKGSKVQQHVDIKGKEDLAEPCKVIHHSASSHFSAKPHSMQQETDPTCYPETSEDFLSSLTKKIHEGFECEGMDMKVLAERLVDMSIQWLIRQSMGPNHSMTDESLVKPVNYSRTSIVDSLMKMLLKTPKDMKQKPTFPPLQASNQEESGSPATENLVKEYELQILFRMEILRSEAAEGIKPSRRRKLVKHICMFLEVIQYLVDGGFHGRLSLYDYVERTIRSRYSHVLEHIVNKIYAQMDMLPFGDVEEDPVHLVNSENSLHSLGETDDIDESDRVLSASAEDDSCRRQGNDIESNGNNNKDKQAHKLVKARERRERDRRFVSFTTWLPDLQRVWAPKQTKQTKKSSDSMNKKTKRKQSQYSSRDMVSETPMSINDQRKRHGESSSNSTPSVYKALFLDDQ
ncbi:uncharacterized protein LOC124928071 [Impatiens glandulifera]|uniref:uncharacterized protein LOC124928071 n=1 Tax=Impatiens glandulifera TaxID=253017 RepID=UPI001FB06D87|nr:uncharacterized protein LOC124928071 [Impatiens glandulifera]